MQKVKVKKWRRCENCGEWIYKGEYAYTYTINRKVRKWEHVSASTCIRNLKDREFQNKKREDIEKVKRNEGEPMKIKEIFEKYNIRGVETEFERIQIEGETVEIRYTSNLTNYELKILKDEDDIFFCESNTPINMLAVTEMAGELWDILF